MKEDGYVASIARVGDHLCLGGVSGGLRVIDPGPAYHEVGESPIKGWAFSTPAFIKDCVYLRDRDNAYCIAADAPAASAATAPSPAK